MCEIQHFLNSLLSNTRLKTGHTHAVFLFTNNGKSIRKMNHPANWRLVNW